MRDQLRLRGELCELTIKKVPHAVGTSARTRARLKLSQEGCLWEIALAYFGPEKLLETIVELGSGAGPPSQPTVEHLSTETLSADVVNILKIAQVRAGALVPGRLPVPGVVTLYARHASDLADGILARLPRSELTRAMRGSQLEVQLGL